MRGNALGYFLISLGMSMTFCVELQAIMEMIEIAQAKGWDHLLIEYDSSLVVQAYESHATVPWWLRIQWSNCWSITCSIHFTISHIFREWNGVLIGLLTLGVCYERQNKGERTTQLRGLGTSIREKDKEETCIIFLLSNTFMFTPIYMHQ